LTDEALRPATRLWPEAATIALLPLAFAVIGLMLRYAAYVTVGPEAAPNDFITELCRWDCGWYVELAERGYDTFPVPSRITAGNWAFFPLSPMLVAGLRQIIALPTIVVGSASSIILSWASALLAWPLLKGDRRAYILFSAFLLAGPFSIYFTTFFTEILFVMLTLAVLLALQRGNYIAAGLCGGLLSATRLVGVFIVLAIAVEAFLDHRRSGGTVRNFIPWVLRRPDVIFAVFVAPIGLFAFMAYLYGLMGDGLAFTHVQRAWGRVVLSPLFYLSDGLTTPPEQGGLPSVSQQLALAWIAGMALTAGLFWRRQYPAAVFCLACLVLPIFAGLASMLRFVAAQAPLMMLLMTMLASRRWLFVVSLGAFLVADYFFTIAWFEGYLTLV
jgi:hypothetical protein